MDSRGLRAIVFDFDGTIFRLFVNYNLHEVSLNMRCSLQELGIDFDDSLDPFDVFRLISNCSNVCQAMKEKGLVIADQILTAAEIEALDSGIVVHGANKIIKQYVEDGMNIGIATNNSALCVKEYFHHVDPGILLQVPVFGRDALHPEMMKPNPAAVLSAVHYFGLTPRQCLFVGDTKRDYEASLVCGCRFAGMASTESKRTRLMSILPPERVFNNFEELYQALSIGL